MLTNIAVTVGISVVTTNKDPKIKVKARDLRSKNNSGNSRIQLITLRRMFSELHILLIFYSVFKADVLCFCSMYRTLCLVYIALCFYAQNAMSQNSI